MGRSDVLSATAIEFLAKNRCAPEYPIDRLREETEILRLPLSAEQLETVANLWNVSYWSRCSFAERRYRVAFFTPPRREGILDFLVRFVSPETPSSAFVGDCDVDETHEPEGLVMDASGALVTWLGPYEPPKTIYRSAYMVVERDAILDALGVEYHGAIRLKPSVTRGEVADKLGDFTLHAGATDSLNALWYSDDTVLVYQAWLSFYLEQPPVIITDYGPVLRVFGKAKQALAEIASRLPEIVQNVAEPGLRWPRRRLSSQESEY